MIMKKKKKPFIVKVFEYLGGPKSQAERNAQAEADRREQLKKEQEDQQKKKKKKKMSLDEAYRGAMRQHGMK
jgi:hypothetical protein